MPKTSRRPTALAATALGASALLAASASALGGQAPAMAAAPPAADSVAVRPGDTLWGLASTRLGDPFRWPEIREVNAERIADPHWIYPKQWLRLPGGRALAAAPESPASTVAEAPTPAAPTVFAEREAAKPAPVPVVPAPRPATAVADARVVRWYGVPFLAEAGAPRGAGAVVDGVDLPPGGARAATRRLQYLDRIILTAPAGRAVSVGDSLLLVRRGPGLGAAQVLMPTGIAVVDGLAGGLVTARLSRVYDVVQAGHAVLPLPPMPPLDAPASATTGRDTRVVWIAGDAELPSLQSVVVLGVGMRDGVREGDRYELVGDGRRISGGAVLPGTRAAVVRVIRVTEHGASATIESQQQPAIARGMLARPLAATR